MESLMEQKLKRRVDLIGEELDDELILYDPSNHNVHVLNPMAVVIWELCDGTHTVRSISKRILSAIEADENTVLEDVLETVREFYNKDLLEI